MSEGNGVLSLAKKVAAVAAAILACISLGTMLGGWAFSKVDQRIEARLAGRDSLLTVTLSVQTATNETLGELVTVLVAPPSPLRERTLRRLRAKYEIGVTR